MIDEKQPPHAPIASAVGPCSTLIQISRRPGTGSLPSTIAPTDLPLLEMEKRLSICNELDHCFKHAKHDLLGGWLVVLG